MFTSTLYPSLKIICRFTQKFMVHHKYFTEGQEQYRGRIMYKGIYRFLVTLPSQIWINWISVFSFSVLTLVSIFSTRSICRSIERMGESARSTMMDPLRSSLKNIISLQSSPLILKTGILPFSPLMSPETTMKFFFLGYTKFQIVSLPALGTCRQNGASSSILRVLETLTSTLTEQLMLMYTPIQDSRYLCYPFQSLNRKGILLYYVLALDRGTMQLIWLRRAAGSLLWQSEPPDE